MKFEIKSRFTSAVLFTAELDVKFENSHESIKLGEAVKQANLSSANLRGADLSYANLSSANLSGADLRGADLSYANLSYANLSSANLSYANLSSANLSGAYLRGADLSSANLSYANLSYANLRGANLSGADLSGADLSSANLSSANLRGADLRGVPFIKNIHQTLYAAASREGCLDMSSWHCGTTHCRAGWVVTLAGEGGAAMEYCLGTPAAAALIYIKSDPTLERIPDFYSDNETALADMKRLAELEASRVTVEEV